MPASAAQSRNDLLVRAIGNYKLAELPAEMDGAKDELKRATISTPQQLLLSAIELNSGAELASVWRDVPMRPVEWIAMKYHTEPARYANVLNTIAAHREETKDELQKALEAVQVAEVKGSDRLLYYACATGKWNIERLADNRMRIYARSGLLTALSETGNSAAWSAEEGGQSYVWLADSANDFASYAMTKPGFTTLCDSQTCWATKNHAANPLTYVSKEGWVTMPWIGGRTLAAPDLGTAVEFIGSKPGFASHYIDGLNWVCEDGDATAIKLDSPFLVKRKMGKWQWTDAFRNKDVADEYDSTVHVPNSVMKKE